MKALQRDVFDNVVILFKFFYGKVTFEVKIESAKGNYI